MKAQEYSYFFFLKLRNLMSIKVFSYDFGDGSNIVFNLILIMFNHQTK